MFSFFKKTFDGLTKTRRKLANTLSVFTGKSYLNEDDIELLEASLIEADLGWKVVDSIIDKLKNYEDKNVSWKKDF